jgi:hypothetical protein
MVSSFVVFTDTTVGLSRAAPHQAAALDLPGSSLISRTAAGFRHDALLQQVICDWPEDRLLGARRTHDTHRHPATGRNVRSPGCTLNGSPTGSSPSAGELDPSASCGSSPARWSGLRQLPAAKLPRVDGLSGPLGEMAVPRQEGYPAR